jgi:uncharacterized protein with PQ loop repeat
MRDNPLVNPGNVAVIVATLLAWSSLLPQIVRLVRTGDTSGISITWPAIGLVSNAAWTAYLLSQALWAATPSTAVMVVFYVVLIRALRRRGASLRQAATRGTAWAVILIAVTALGGWTVGGLVLSWSYVVQIAPAVWGVFSTRAPTGVSPSTWAIITVESALWGFYGWWFADAPVVVFGIVGTIGGSSILIRLAALRLAGSRGGDLSVSRRD